METTQVTVAVRGETSPGEVIAVVGSCESLGGWSHEKAVILHPHGNDGNTWTTTITVPKGVVAKYRYLKGFFLESKIQQMVADCPSGRLVTIPALTPF